MKLQLRALGIGFVVFIRTWSPVSPQCVDVALVTEALRNEVTEVHLVAGATRTIVPGLGFPHSVALGPGGNVAYVTEQATGELSAVDLVTGRISTIASGLFGLTSPGGLAVNATGTTAFVARTSSGELLEVDLATGATSRAAGGLTEPRGVALDPTETTAYVAAREQLVMVDLSSGGLTSVASGFGRLVDVAINSTGSTAYVVDNVTDRVSAIDIASGTVTFIFSIFNGDFSSVELNSSDTTMFVVGTSGLYAVDLPHRTWKRIGSGLMFPSGVAVDMAETTAYVTERFEGRLSAVDLATGNVRAASSGLNEPRGIAFNANRSTAYVAEFGSGNLSAIDVNTGAIRTVAVGLDEPVGVVVNAAESLAYVTEARSWELSAVDLATGAVTVVARDLSNPGELELDSSESIAYVLGGPGLVAVSLLTGDVRTIASAFGDTRGGLALNATQTLAYVTVPRVIDHDSRLVRVELSTGAISILTTDSGFWRGLALDATGRTALVADIQRGLLAIDLGPPFFVETLHGASSLTSGVVVSCRPCISQPDCDDRNSCTLDACDFEFGTCSRVALADGASCSDDIFCNGEEICAQGRCQPGRGPTCDDNNPCTANTCDEEADLCLNPASPDGRSCSDFVFCNGAETCQGGLCQAAAPLTCDDGNPCTVDVCDETMAACVSTTAQNPDFLFPAPLISAGDQPGTLTVGDLNADGAPDLLVGTVFYSEDPSSGYLLLFPGQCDGTVGQETRIRVPGGIVQTATADLDGDGSSDGAILFTGGSNGTGGIAFLVDSQLHSLSLKHEPTSFALGDYDHDSSPDLAVVFGLDRELCIFLDVTPGQLPSPQCRAVDAGSGTLTQADLNADGSVDLILLSSAGSVLVALGAGDGSFSPFTSFTAGDRPLDVAVGDLDMNGTLDLAVANLGLQETSDVSILKGRGDGSFEPARSIALRFRPSRVVAGQFSADTVPDLVLLDGDNNAVVVLLGVGDASFGEEMRHAVGFLPRDLAAADFDCDQRQDLVAVNPGSRDVVVLRGNDSGTFGPPWIPLPGQPVSVASGDLNGDQRSDLAISHYDSGIVTVLLLSDKGQVLSRQSYEVGEAPLPVAIADMDGDEISDIVVGLWGGAVTLLLGRGDGTFSPRPGPLVGSALRKLHPGDFNEDGVQDLAVSSFQVLWILFGSGGGAFQPPIMVLAGFGYFSGGSAEVLDWNGDDHLDVAVVDSAGILVRPGRGEGSFSPAVRFPASLFDSQSFRFRKNFTNLAYTDLTASGDFDGDGLQDIAILDDPECFCDEPRSRIFIQFGGNEDITSSSGGISLSTLALSISAGDFDGDGRSDLSITELPEFSGPSTFAPTPVSLWLGRGDRTFRLRGRFAVGVDAYDATAGDFDGNGNLDLAVLSALPSITDLFGERRVVLLLNQSPSCNQPPTARIEALDRVECASEGGSQVRLVASASSDPDSTEGTNDDIVLFEWFEDFELPSQTLLGAGEILDVRFGVGTHSLTLRVTDKAGATGLAHHVLNVEDTADPRITCPVLAASECTSPAGAWVGAMAQVEDACDPAVEVSNDRTSGGRDASDVYALGSTTVTFFARDASGNAASCTSVVRVNDNVPPALSVVVDPQLLWPPNHRMVEVEGRMSVSDACSAVTVALESISSSEPDDAPGLGDGQTVLDIQGAEIGTADLQLSLRAERAGGGSGRVYSIVYRASDSSGNSALATTGIVVPHDRVGVSEPLVIAAAPGIAGTVISWTPVPEAVSYRLVRGDIHNLRDAGDSFEMGSLDCLAPGVSGTSTGGVEDPFIPAPGSAYFYLVESEGSGRASGYGTADAAKPRESSSADGCQ